VAILVKNIHQSAKPKRLAETSTFKKAAQVCKNPLLQTACSLYQKRGISHAAIWMNLINYKIGTSTGKPI